MFPARFDCMEKTLKCKVTLKKNDANKDILMTLLMSFSGIVLHTVQFPARYITSCCFGGKNYDVLYVTSAMRALTPEEKDKEPLAGSVFKVTGLGVKGTPMVAYRG